MYPPKLSKLHVDGVAGKTGGSITCLARSQPSTITPATAVFDCLHLDRQTVTIPSRDKVYPTSLAALIAYGDILEDFVDGMTDVRTAVGIWRSVVKNKILSSPSIYELLPDKLSSVQCDSTTTCSRTKSCST